MNKVSLRVDKIVNVSKRFERHVKKLDNRTRKQFEIVIDELLTGTISQGRHLEKKEGSDSVYTIRINRKYRFAFVLNADNTITPIAVGSHDLVYRNR